MAGNELQIQIGAVTKGLEDALKSASSSLDAFAKKTKKTGESMQRVGGTLTKTLTAPLLLLGTLAVKTASDFQTLNVALKTTFQGNEKAAKKAFDQIVEFAAKTPFQVSQVADAFIKLKNFGLDPSERALTSYGNTAAAMGKSLNQIVEAVADAATGEFERLKEFGIKAKQQGDEVTLTFRGVATTIKKDAESIQGYLLELGETNFAGGMEAQSKTFAGQLSTLKDNVALALQPIGELLIQYINPLVKKIGELAKKFQELDPETQKFYVQVGLLVLALGPLLTVIGRLIIALPLLAKGFGFLGTTVIPAVASAFGTLNAFMLANPVVAIAAGIAVLTGAFLSLMKQLTPAISGLKTMFNLIRAGGNYTLFLTFQIQDQVKAQNDADMAGAKLARTVDIMRMNNELLAPAIAKTTEEIKKGTVAVEEYRSKFAGMTTDGFKAPSAMDTGDSTATFLPFSLEGIRTSFETINAELTRFNERASDIINNGIAQTFMGLGALIGEGLSGGTDVLKKAGDLMLGVMGDMLVQFGQLAIATGIGMKAVKTALESFGWAGAIAAGVAMIAIGKAVKGKMSSMSEGLSGGSSGGSGGGFSGGGGSQVSGGTFGGGGGTVVFEIAGTKLIGVINNTVNRNRALGGNFTLTNG